uniref:E3 ubiquitin-protein ligase NEURL3 n=1 Tax=Callithrix jacchus TaxID=9483 RepID=A0A5F4VXF3_CALJA
MVCSCQPPGLAALEDAKAPREALRFHAEAKGAQVRLDKRGCTAHRLATFHDGIVFSQRPVRRDERVALRVLREEHSWCGGLRVGFTRLDPALVSAPSLPPFVCPDLEEQSPTWAAVLPEGCALVGDVVRFWVDRRGRLFAKVNAGCRLLLREGVPAGGPLWAVMDVYGTTKAIELLGEATVGTLQGRWGDGVSSGTPHHPRATGRRFTFSYSISRCPVLAVKMGTGDIR